ncbi:mixed lineage kinase domain-like protein [Trachinotus anak]|uniref:mixed lineage kinase domain-like protein n=1 Tax=Trachinotus anak TaxID=443729 RepID=UPI0039F1AFED
MDYVEAVESILSIAFEIYQLVENVKANKKRCRRVCERVKAVEQLVTSTKERKKIQVSKDVDRALEELTGILTAAKTLIEKYTSTNWAKRIVKVGSYAEDFNIVNERIREGYELLLLALNLEHGNKLHEVYAKVCSQKDDEDAAREDDAELKDLLLENMREQQEKLDALKLDVEKLITMLDKPAVTESNRMIKQRELEYEADKEPFMITSTSEVYKGTFCGFTVAIKRYKDPMTSSPEAIRRTFKREVETLKQFESPNILRMYGICVQGEDGPRPQLLVITEYCEMGSLREVLDSDAELLWPRKARMCLDAAQGLFRLHHTEVKSKVHGCITSSKFLVAEGYRVKLGGFELAKTETSLRRSKIEDSRPVCYASPQKLDDASYEYTLECEIYSFGIVLWEIATRKKPFDGLKVSQIQQIVCKDRSGEELPDDCPGPLQKLINDCRQYDSFRRPSSGEVVDKLRILVAELDKK